MSRRHRLAAAWVVAALLAAPALVVAPTRARAEAEPSPAPSALPAPEVKASDAPDPKASAAPEAHASGEPVAATSPEPAASPAPEASPSPAPEKPKKKETLKEKLKRLREEKAAKSKDKKAKPKELPKEKKASGPQLPPILQSIEDKYARNATMTADFDQINYVAAMDQKKPSSGKIEVKRPDKIRWETLKPDPNLLVSDGKTFWFYTPPFDPSEHGQVIEKKTEEVQSKLAQALLTGRFSMARDMKIQREGANSFALIPKPGTAGTVTNARIEIDPKTRLITKVVLEHKGGNRSEITLSHIDLGRPLDDKRFVFEAPANTDKLKQ